MDTSSYTKLNVNRLKEFRKNFYSVHIEGYTFKTIYADLSKELGNDFSVIDLACGDGFNSRIIRDFTNGEIYGVDYSKNYLEEAAAMEKQDPKNIMFFYGDCFEDISEIIFKGEKKFDVVNVCWLFNYASTEEIFLKGMKNVSKLLKEKGILVMCTHNVFTYCADMHKYQNHVGVSSYPIDRNFEKGKLENGERIDFILHEPDNEQNVWSDPYQNYYWTKETYEKAFELAGFKSWKYIDLKINPEFPEKFKEYEDASKHLALLIQARF